MKFLSNEELIAKHGFSEKQIKGYTNKDNELVRPAFGASKIANIKLDIAHRSITNEQEILDFFEEKTIHCVKCKEDFVSDPDIVYPVKNSKSISVLRLDGSMINGVPYLVCTNCEYKNSVSKLLRQTI